MRCFVALLLVLTLVHSTTLFGDIYEADHFTKLNNTIVKVDGPATTQIIADEKYSVTVPEGEYKITAVHYEEGKIDYITEEEIVASGSETKFDLALIPYELYLLTPKPASETANVSSGNGSEIPKPPEEANNDLLYIVAGAIAIIGIVFVIFRRRQVADKITKQNTEPETPSSGSKTQDSEMGYLPDKEARNVLKILKENEGRMYQKELREILNWSEAKMSITITELETAGLVKRFKKGRDNMLKLLKE